MEKAFGGVDFSQVKVHNDAVSDQLNQSIQARAFTTWQDVFFRGGEYNPGSRGGQELIAHELTHVVQQNEGVVQRSHWVLIGEGTIKKVNKKTEGAVEIDKGKLEKINVLIYKRTRLKDQNEIEAFDKQHANKKLLAEFPQLKESKIPLQEKGTKPEELEIKVEHKETEQLEVKVEHIDIKLGKHIASGGNKNVYAVEGQEGTVIGVLKEGKPASAIEEEIKLLEALQAQGLPTVEVLGKTTHNGQPAIVMKEYAQGSKEIVKLQKGTIKTVVGGQSELLNERSIEDLTNIRSIMESKPVKIDDLQFLIGKDGSMVIADPLKVIVGESPSKNNLKMIKLLLESARTQLEKIEKISNKV